MTILLIIWFIGWVFSLWSMENFFGVGLSWLAGPVFLVVWPVWVIFWVYLMLKYPNLR